MPSKSQATYPKIMVPVGCSLLLLLVQQGIAWIPLSGVGVRPAIARGSHHARARLANSSCKSKVPNMLAGGGGRPNLLEMRRGFERSLDGKLVMEYVKELRERKELLIMELARSSGVITKEIYPIMEELALVNPSGGCGNGADGGKGHYTAMLQGKWIAASTLVPGVPVTYGEGESPPVNPKFAPRIPNGEGATCTLGELAKALTGYECVGDFDADMVIRPRRLQLTNHRNIVEEGAMPNVLANARYAVADEAKLGATSEQAREASHKALASRAAADAEGTGAREEGFPSGTARASKPKPSKTLRVEDGTVRTRAVWEVRGENHLAWEYDRVAVESGKQVASTTPAGAAGVEVTGKGGWAGIDRSVYEFFLDQNMFIMAWKRDPGPEDAMVFLRDDASR